MNTPPLRLDTTEPARVRSPWYGFWREVLRLDRAILAAEASEAAEAERGIEPHAPESAVNQT